MLWLGLHLSALPVEIFTRGRVKDTPFAVSDAHATRPTLVACNEAAVVRGIHPGQTVNAALVLDARLVVQPRDEQAEQAALARLAGWAYQYTARVCPVPPQGLLLEIGASLTLFGGRQRLCRQIEHGLEALGYTTHMGIAPTPLGAWWLATADSQQTVTEIQTLPEALDPLPLNQLDLPPETIRTLHGMGIQNLGACRGLPREGLARRFGQELLDTLDRAYGLLPDPRVPYQPPARFEAALPLPDEVSDTEALAFPLQRLLRELTGYLMAHQTGVERLQITFAHARGSTPLRLGLATPSRDADHLLGLLREHLNRIELAGPVQAVGLTAEALQSLAPRNLSLFDEHQAPGTDQAVLLEHLQARLGPETISGLKPATDHRPEQAWQRCEPGQVTKLTAASPGPRPLWLLPSPEPLRVIDGRPAKGGLLSLQAGPERIETGWWDGSDVQRDYFVAQNTHGSRYWVFRERRAGGQWFLQGIFA